MRDVEIDEAESNKLLLRRKADNVHSALLRRAYFCFRPLSGDLGLWFRDFLSGEGAEQIRLLRLLQRFQQRRPFLLQVGQPAL